MLRRSVDAGLKGMQSKAQPWTIRPPDFFTDVEIVRELAATIIDCQSQDISIIPSASYGIATAAKNLTVDTNEEILVLDEQFPSNVYAWIETAKQSGATVKQIPRPTDGDWTEAIINAVSSNTKVAALPHCHWIDGSFIDLEKVAISLRNNGTALVVDATQSLGAMPLNLAKIQPDFLIAACYKWLLGPYSTGLLYVAPKHQGGDPIEFSWTSRAGAEDFRNLAIYRNEYQLGARRYDAGERSNFALLPPLIIGLQQIIDWSVTSIYETISGLTKLAAIEAENLGLRVGKNGLRSGHFLGIQLPSSAPKDLVDQLGQRDIFLSRRGDSLRITPHVYNCKQDIDVLFHALTQLL